MDKPCHIVLTTVFGQSSFGVVQDILKRYRSAFDERAIDPEKIGLDALDSIRLSASDVSADLENRVKTRSILFAKQRGLVPEISEEDAQRLSGALDRIDSGLENAGLVLSDKDSAKFERALADKYYEAYMAKKGVLVRQSAEQYVHRQVREKLQGRVARITPQKTQSVLQVFFAEQLLLSFHNELKGRRYYPFSGRLWQPFFERHKWTLENLKAALQDEDIIGFEQDAGSLINEKILRELQGVEEGSPVTLSAEKIFPLFFQKEAWIPSLRELADALFDGEKKRCDRFGFDAPSVENTRIRQYLELSLFLCVETLQEKYASGRGGRVQYPASFSGEVSAEKERLGSLLGLSDDDFREMRTRINNLLDECDLSSVMLCTAGTQDVQKRASSPLPWKRGISPC